MESLEGETYGPYPLRVCAEKVAEFVSATSDDPIRWHQSAPPGWIAACLFVVAPDLLNLPALGGGGVIHGEQKFHWNGPFRVESTLTVTGQVDRVRSRSGVNFIGFALKVTEGEEELAGGSSTFLVSGESPAAGESQDEPEPMTDVGDVSESEPFVRSVSRAGLVRYAAATRDWNPIHWDHNAARTAGLPGVVAHGLLQTAWLMSYASALRPDPAPLTEAAFRFRAPLRPNVMTSLSVEEEGSVLNVRLNAGDLDLVSGRISLR